MTRVLLALAVLASALGAQSLETVVLEGQALPGGGTVTGIRYVHLNPGEAWLVQVTTDQPRSPSAVLRKGIFWSSGDGPLWHEVGDRVPDPAGARIAAFDSFSNELFGGVCWNARLQGTPGGSSDDEALYFENSLWIQEGPIESFPSTDFPPGSRWISFDDLRATSQSGEVLLRGRADDPTVAGPDETFAAVGSLCGTVGLLCGLERFAQEGWHAPGTARLIESVRLEPGAAAIAPQNVDAVWSCDLAGAVDSDGCVYQTHFFPMQHVLLAQEGSPSPVAGRRWGPLDELGLHVNSSGSWTLRAALDASDPATDAIIVKDGAAFVREGDTLPDIAPYTFDGFGRGRALLDQGGHVVWYGHWDEHGHSSEGLFRDDRLLVRTGQVIGGQVLASLGSGPDDIALTPKGDMLLFKGTLAGGLEGAFVLEVGP